MEEKNENDENADSSKMAMMKCMCDSCKSYEECLSSATMANLKAFCTMENAMETWKKFARWLKKRQMHGWMKMENNCMVKIKIEDCVCKECPVAEEFQLNDMMFCKK